MISNLKLVRGMKSFWGITCSISMIFVTLQVRVSYSLNDIRDQILVSFGWNILIQYKLIVI